MAFDPSDEKDVAFLASEIEKANKGVANKNTELLGELKKVQGEFKEFQTKFDGIDPVEVKKILAQLEQTEEGRLLAEGKIDEVVNARTERFRAESDRKVKEAQDSLTTFRTRTAAFMGNVRDNEIRIAASEAGVLPGAMDDIVLRGSREFTVNDEGQVIAMRGQEVVLGKDGKTPLTPKEWVEGVREKAPHLWPAASGGNAGGAGGGSVKKKWSDMGEKERVDLYNTDPKAYAAAKAADTAKT